MKTGGYKNSNIIYQIYLFWGCFMQSATNQDCYQTFVTPRVFDRGPSVRTNSLRFYRVSVYPRGSNVFCRIKGQ